jgi:hypothetical protein
MIKGISFGIAVDKGVIQPKRKQPFKGISFGIAIDCGTIPFKNYYPSKVISAAIAVGPANPDMIFVQII